MKDKVVV